MMETSNDIKLVNSTSINNTNDNNNCYRLRVNLNGFKKDDIKVNLINEGKVNKIEVTAACKEFNEQTSCDTIKEYKKVFELPTKNYRNLDLMTMCSYIDNDQKHLIIEFKSNLNDNQTYNSLNNSNDDDLYLNLIEQAANYLTNFKNLDDIKQTIEHVLNPCTPPVTSPSSETQTRTTSKEKLTTNNKNINNRLSLDNDIHLLSTNYNLPPMHLLSNPDGSKLLQVTVKVPETVTKVVKTNPPVSVSVDDNSNQLYLTCNQLTISLDAEAKNGESSSKFTKKFNLPNGTDYEHLSYNLDNENHSLIIEAPFKN